MKMRLKPSVKKKKEKKKKKKKKKGKTDETRPRDAPRSDTGWNIIHSVGPSDKMSAFHLLSVCPSPSGP